MKQFYPSQCLFLVLNKSFRHKRETSDSNVVTVLNSMPPEMYPTGRRVKQRALQGMNVVFSAAVCSLLFFPRLFFPLIHLSPVFCSVSLLRFTFSAVPFIRVITNVCPRPLLQLRFCVLFSLSDHQFIKCLHTTEIIRGIPGCVSI